MEGIDEKLEQIIEILQDSEFNKEVAADRLRKNDLQGAAACLFAAGLEQEALNLARKAEQHVNGDPRAHKIRLAALYAVLGNKEDFMRYVDKISLDFLKCNRYNIADWISGYLPIRRLFDT